MDDRELALSELQSEIAFEHWHHKGGPLPRLCAEQGEIQDDVRPLYRHPIDSCSCSLVAFTPAVLKIKGAIEKLLYSTGQCSFNHCLIQLYRDGDDSISEHSDKTLDILNDSVICNFSVGATRTLILRKKCAYSKNLGVSVDDGDYDAQMERDTRRFSLPHNSLFVMSLGTNRDYTHQIKQDKRAPRDKTREEEGIRISFTFRSIATFYNCKYGVVFGQGALRRPAVATTAAAAATDEPPGWRLYEEEEDETSDESQVRRLLAAFSAENKTAKSWQELYGHGFSILGIGCGRGNESGGGK